MFQYLRQNTPPGRHPLANPDTAACWLNFMGNLDPLKHVGVTARICETDRIKVALRSGQKPHWVVYVFGPRDFEFPDPAACLEAAACTWQRSVTACGRAGVPCE